MLNYITDFYLANMGIFNIKQHFNKSKKLKTELIKYSNIDSVKVIDLPDEAYAQVDETKIEENEVYKKTYELFGKRIQEIVPKEELGNFYRNFADIKSAQLSLKIAYSRFLTTGGIAGGAYDTSENILYLKEGFISKAIGALTHELLHASSTYYDKKKGIVYIGLSQTYINKDDPKHSEVYGLALNEGYTQYFNNKYFVDNDSVTLSFFGKDHTVQADNIITKQVYEEEQIIAKALETIVGEEKMRSFYFRGDLNGLIKELEQYAPRETIYQFINFTDTLCFYSNNKNAANEELKEVKTFINSLILRMYMKSQKKNNKDLTNDEILEFMSSCLPYKDSGTNKILISSDYLDGKPINITNENEGKKKVKKLANNKDTI